uniref:UDP-glucuronosyltransferase n=1 Tax=Caenorhabditis tropicalis TaxID=1561998 RepID=A0A1I7UPU8_9PELO
MRPLLFLALCTNLVFSYKILVFSPATSKSHLISNGRLADELARAGHDVTVLELDFLKISETTNSVKVAKKRVIGGFKEAANFKNVLLGFSETVMEEPSFTDEVKGWWAYQNVYNDLCAEFLQRDKIFAELKNEQFDGFFAEQINLCGFGYAHALGIPRRFLISSCPFAAPVYDYTGLPMPTSTVPFAADMSVTPTYYERARNFFAAVVTKVEFALLNCRLHAHFQQKFGEEFPTPYNIVSNVDVIFIATDEIIDISTTTLQNIVHVGGLGVDDDVTELDATFAAEMQKGKNGVIYFSLGTIANTTKIDKKVMKSVLDVVKKFPDYHFVIRADKYDKNTRSYAKSVPNAFVSDWLPQPAILHHPRLQLFITHSGYNSIVEAARAGVPLINIPFMFDQNLNSRAVEKKGWGIRRHKKQLVTEPEAIEEAIHQIIHNKQYKEKAERIRNLIKSKPLSASQLLVKTTEWAIKNHGLDEIKFESRSHTTWTYYNLDVLLPILWIVLSFIIPTIIGWYKFSCFGHIEEKRNKMKNE